MVGDDFFEDLILKEPECLRHQKFVCAVNVDAVVAAARLLRQPDAKKSDGGRSRGMSPLSSQVLISSGSDWDSGDAGHNQQSRVTRARQ